MDPDQGRLLEHVPIVDARPAAIELEDLRPPGRVAKHSSGDPAQRVATRDCVPTPPISLLDKPVRRSRNQHRPAWEDQAATGYGPTVALRATDVGVEQLFGALAPNLEPVVRICQQVRQGQSDTHGPLPIEHVFGHVSYLHSTTDVLQITVLHLDLGQRWAYPDSTPDRAEHS